MLDFLPKLVYLNICEFLSLDDCKNLCVCNKSLRSLYFDEDFWCLRFNLDFGSQIRPKSWFNCYKYAHKMINGTLLCVESGIENEYAQVFSKTSPPDNASVEHILRWLHNEYVLVDGEVWMPSSLFGNIYAMFKTGVIPKGLFRDKHLCNEKNNVDFEARYKDFVETKFDYPRYGLDIDETGDVYRIEEGRVPWPIGLKKIISISGGFINDSYCLFLDQNGSVYSVGSNKYGQLGINSDLKRTSKPIRITGLSEIVQISSAPQHSLCLDVHGNMFSFGSGSDGELGLDYIVYDWGEESWSEEDWESFAEDGYKSCIVWTPQKIPYPNNVKQISSGYAHNLVLDRDGRVWAFGNDINGQCFLFEWLGLISTPTVVHVPNGKEKVKSVHAVHYASFIFKY